jgi:hypothetical protein
MDKGREAKMESSQEKTTATPPGSPHRRSARIGTYIAIAGGAFAFAMLVLLLMFYKAETLVRLGLVGNLYYVLLVPLGLAVAAFLFGVLRSHAVYKGQVAGGSLELGGPIVAFVLVVILGFYLIPNSASFPLTVFVHGEQGRQEILLRNTGSLLLDLGGDRRREAIGDKGQAYFPGIPALFRGQTVGVALEAEGFELAKPDSAIKIEADSAYLAVRPKSAPLTGYVRASNGQPILGVTVSIAGVNTLTDANGYF